MLIRASAFLALISLGAVLGKTCDSTELICDPEEIFDQELLANLHNDLQKISELTSHDSHKSVCGKKGVTVVLTVAQTTPHLKKYELKDVDPTCHKAVELSLAIRDKKLVISRDAAVAEQFTDDFDSQTELFESGKPSDVHAAFEAILKKLAEQKDRRQWFRDTSNKWKVADVPNPAVDFAKCNMLMVSNICDPEDLLDEGTRNRLNTDLKMMETRTRQENGKDFCEKKGISAAMVVLKNVEGGDDDGAEKMANELLKTWKLDSQCQKDIVIVVSVDDSAMWVARDDKVPVIADEITAIFEEEKEMFGKGLHRVAIESIIKGITKSILSKQPKLKAGTVGDGTIPAIPEQSKGGFSTGMWIIVIIVVVGCGGLGGWFCCCKKQKPEERARLGNTGGLNLPPNTPQVAANLLNRIDGTMASDLIGKGINLVRGQNAAAAQAQASTAAVGAARPGYSPVSTGPGTSSAGGAEGTGVYPSTAHRDGGGGGKWN